MVYHSPYRIYAVVGFGEAPKGHPASPRLFFPRSLWRRSRHNEREIKGFWRDEVPPNLPFQCHLTPKGVWRDVISPTPSGRRLMMWHETGLEPCLLELQVAQCCDLLGQGAEASVSAYVGVGPLL